MRKALLNRIASTHSAVAYQAAIEGELTRLEHHVNRLLEVQQMQAGQRQYNFVSASLSEVAACAIDELSPQAAAKQIRVEFDAGRGLPALQLDRAAMTDAIANLIGNAIKYSPVCSRIGVSTRLADDTFV